MFSALRGWPLGRGALRRRRQLSSESTPRRPQPHPGLLQIQRQQIAFRARPEELITDIQVPHGISTHVGCTVLLITSLQLFYGPTKIRLLSLRTFSWTQSSWSGHRSSSMNACNCVSHRPAGYCNMNHRNTESTRQEPPICGS